MGHGWIPYSRSPQDHMAFSHEVYIQRPAWEDDWYRAKVVAFKLIWGQHQEVWRSPGEFLLNASHRTKVIDIPLRICLQSEWTYVSVKSKLQHAPPGNPRGIWLFWKLLFKFKCPHPREHFTGTKMTEGRRKRLQLSNKIFINITKTLLAYLLRTKNSCKAAEIAATRSLNAQLFFVMQHTKRSIKKRSHLLRPFHWHASSLTLLINILAVGQSS